MSDQQSLLAPKKADGTTDWDIVFDDPERGLVALIDRVTSVGALHQCTQIMIERLFTRKNDQLDIARFNRELDKIISFAGIIGDLSAVKQEVILLLKRIKAERVEKSREFQEKISNKKSRNRRSSLSLAATIYRLINHPKLLPVTITSLLFAGILVGGVFYLVSSTAPIIEPKIKKAESKMETPVETEEEKKKKEQEAIEQKVKSAADRKLAALNKAVEDKFKKEDPVMPPALVIQALYVHQKASNGKLIKKAYVPMFVLDNSKNLARLCKVLPKVIDTLNLALNDVLLNKSNGRQIELIKTAEKVRTSVNGFLSGNIVTKIVLATSVKHQDLVFANNRCRFATDRYLYYIYPKEDEK